MGSYGSPQTGVYREIRCPKCGHSFPEGLNNGICPNCCFDTRVNEYVGERKRDKYIRREYNKPVLRTLLFIICIVGLVGLGVAKILFNTTTNTNDRYTGMTPTPMPTLELIPTPTSTPTPTLEPTPTTKILIPKKSTVNTTYSSNKDEYAIELKLTTKKGTNVKTDCFVNVRIINSEEQKVYDKNFTLFASDFGLNGAVIFVKKSQIKVGWSSLGKVYITVESLDGTTFSLKETVGKIDGLPYTPPPTPTPKPTPTPTPTPLPTYSIKLKKVDYPYAIYQVDRNDVRIVQCNIIKAKIKQETVTEGDYDYHYNYISISLELELEKIYDFNDPYTAKRMPISYCIKDEDGYVVHTGTIYSVNIAPGEKTKISQTIWPDLDMKHTYTLEFKSTKE